MTHRELDYQKICVIKHTDLFRLIFQKVGSTKNAFDSHGSGVKSINYPCACVDLRAVLIAIDARISDISVILKPRILIVL